MNMKYFYSFFFILISFYIFADNIYSSFDYTRTSNEPIVWYPEAGVYNSSIYLSLNSEHGKIFYIVGDDFLKNEPREFSKEIILRGKEGAVSDYKIFALLEKENGNIEIYSRVYRIDKTNKFKKKYYKDGDYLKKKVKQDGNDIDLIYDFSSNRYGVTFKESEFIYPQAINDNESKTKEVKLKGENFKRSMYLVNLTYIKGEKVYTEVHTYPINLEKVKPPSFGSLYWGQVYKQSYKIKIKPDKPEDKIYYWLREWENSDYIVGPPLQSREAAWQEYSGAFELSSKYGKDGIIGVAAFSVGKSGFFSKIAGPYYFKVMDVDNTFEQVFEENFGNKDALRKVTINGDEFKGTKVLITGQAVVDFSNFDIDDRFYFAFKNRDTEGKSEFLPCDQPFYFKNTEILPVDFALYMSNGDKIAEFTLNGEKLNLPVMKDYIGNYVDVSSDTIIDFYMPDNIVRYQASGNKLKYLDITENSPVFNGSIKLTTEPGKEESFKIKFGAFDSNNNLIGETEDLYFKIDKLNPVNEVEAEGVDFKISHNEKQVLKLTHTEDDVTIFYRLSKDDSWVNYEKPISFYPPVYGKYSVDVYTKSVDEAGNELENKEPFKILFDTRAIFVDSKQEFSGNGTEFTPYNSIERAVEYAKIKNIKLIYILSNFINVSFPITVDSDVIIQPYNPDIRPVFIMDTKSVWKKRHVWFDLNKSGYLELRNIDFKVLSGNCFSDMLFSKLKLYNINLIYSGNDSFSFIKNIGGDIGISNLAFNITENPDDFLFIDADSSNLILRDIRFKIKAKNLLFFNILDNSTLDLNYMHVLGEAEGSVKFINSNGSNVVFSKVIYKQKGDFTDVLLYNLKKSSINVKESDFIIEGKNPFSIRVLEQNHSNSKFLQSLFWIKDAATVIGFDSVESDISFEQSIINAERILDYIYNFRGKDSNIEMYSSIIRNMDCTNAVSFILNKGSFEGANNSIFNINVKGRSFNFWVTDISWITTVNSIFYFNNRSEESAFLYLNNPSYTAFKPAWFSNAVSSNVVLFENLEKKDSKEILADFNEKNLYFDFTNEFSVDSEGFFIPKTDSPLLQGGLSQYSSPVKILEKDFFGRDRVVQGIGIDIGAVQKSGHF